MRDGGFVNQEGERITHLFKNATNQQKGLKTILSEQGRWRIGTKKGDAVDLLRAEPDFIGQK